MVPGIYNISNAEYHASEGISRSAISELQNSPLHYFEKYLSSDREIKLPTAAMILGTAVHTLVLEPNKFFEDFIIQMPSDGRTKEGKEYRQHLERMSAGKTIITEEDFNKADVMAKSVLAHPKSSQLLLGADIEKSIYWIDEDTGILCKARPDAWNKTIEVITDLKTSKSPSPSSFGWSVKDGNYHIQAAMQIDGIYKITGNLIKDFVFVVVPTEKPYMPYIYRLSDDGIELGRKEYKNALKIIKKCLEENKWDRDRECILHVSFSENQLNTSSFSNLMGIYNV